MSSAKWRSVCAAVTVSNIEWHHLKWLKVSPFHNILNFLLDPLQQLKEIHLRKHARVVLLCKIFTDWLRKAKLKSVGRLVLYQQSHHLFQCGIFSFGHLLRIHYVNSDQNIFPVFYLNISFRNSVIAIEKWSFLSISQKHFF